MKFKLVIPTLLMLALNAHAGLLYTYSGLATKDLDEMNKIVQAKIKEAHKSDGDKIIPLKEGVQAVYSRPNDDFMIEKVISPLKTELEGLDAWEDSVKALVKEAIGALKNPKAFKPSVQVTYNIFLQNILSEFKPNITQDFEKSVIATIRDANIKVTSEAKNESTLTDMKEVSSPSDTAAKILPKEDPKKDKK